MRRFNTIIESANPPGINQLWIDKKKLRYFTEGKWHLLGDGGSNPPEISNHDTWIIDGVDTGKPTRGEEGSKGDNGLTPFIGTNKHWWIGTTDTGVVAEGTDGIDGDNGLTPQLRVTDDAVEYSYDGVKWIELIPKSDFVVNNEITNSPDEEDLTSVNDKLKLKNKVYSPAEFSGLGRTYLRKNITGSKNILTQDMINTGNTIYIIQYDYDLNGAEITIPENCILKFEGGSLKNGTLNGNNTYIRKDDLSKIFDLSINLNDKFKIGYFTPQNFGGKGDGIFDNSSIFQKLDLLQYNVFVPKGDYIVSNMVFSTAKKWEFEISNGLVADKHSQWWSESAVILTDTTTKITGGPIIYNLHIEYNGSIADIKDRPIGMIMNSHWCEIHRMFIRNFYVGMEFGNTGHCDYTRIYQLNSWYNYFAGVKITHTSSAQVNFVSFFDCNIGANGVSPSDGNIEPDITRGYGFYISGGNAIYINNVDVSGNETCGFYIDSDVSTKQIRGLHVSTFYAEGNKYCNIYFNNSKSESQCRSSRINFDSCYVYSITNSQYFKSNVVCSKGFIPPTVKLSDNSDDYYKEGYNSLDRNRDIFIDLSGSKTSMDLFLKQGNKYQITLNIKAVTTGQITFQNIITKRYVNKNDGVTPYTERIETQKAFNLQVTEGSYYNVVIGVQAPILEDINHAIIYSPATYGAEYIPLNYIVQNITGNTEIPKNPIKGCSYLNENGTNYYDGESWYVNGYKQNIKYSGTFATKPSASDIKVGFAYFCTDKQTTEGQTNGIMIYHKGNDVWVDALGRTIS